MLRSLLFASVAVLAVACTNSTSEPGPNGPNGPSDENVPTTPASNEQAGYRVNLPQGSSPTPTEKSPGVFEYTTPAGNVIVTVKPGDQAAFDAAKAQYTTKAESFGGHARATDTQLSSAWRESATGPRSSATLLYSTGKIYECTVTSASAPTLMVCQSLKAL